MEKAHINFKTKDHKEVWDLVESINSAWLNNQTELLYNYFHESMAISGPDFFPMGTGRDFCIKYYKDFCSQATNSGFSVSNPRIDIYETTAIVSYQFQLTITMDDFDTLYKGKDIFIFTRNKNKWLAVWRVVINEE